MTKLVRGAFGSALLALAIPLPALAQGAAAGALADLAARVKAVQNSPAQMDTMIKVGRRVASFCANCHGDGGNSVKPDVPNLAGQNALYLLAQLREFSTTQRKSNEFKKRLVNVLSADEKVGMVVFYAGQPVVHKPASDAAAVRKGADLYAKRCASCHEQDGRGSSSFSRIAGQQVVYLSQSLKGYRDGTGPRLDSDMVKEVKALSDPDIDAIVAFVSSMK